MWFLYLAKKVVRKYIGLITPEPNFEFLTNEETIARKEANQVFLKKTVCTIFQTDLLLFHAWGT